MFASYCYLVGPCSCSCTVWVIKTHHFLL